MHDQGAENILQKETIVELREQITVRKEKKDG
jgi:hypothetical protein